MYLLSGPNEMHLATNTVVQVKDLVAPKTITNAVTAVWIESLTTTAPSTLGGATGGGEGMGGTPGAMGGGPGGGYPGPGAGTAGEGMSSPGGGSTGSATSVTQLEDITTLYLKLKAKNILPRERETLNYEFAQLLAKRFREHEMFDDTQSGDEGQEYATRVTGKIPPGKPEERWFEFTIQVKLKTPIKMQDKDETEEEY